MIWKKHDRAGFVLWKPVKHTKSNTDVRARKASGDGSSVVLHRLVTKRPARSRSGLVSCPQPLRDSSADNPLGTCTDVHDNVQTKISAAQTREQLLSVLKHGKVTLFTVDTERRVTLLEGSLIWDKAEEL